MTRAHFETYLLDEDGRPIPGATVTVREPDTETTISETVYAEDDTAGDTEAGNPFTADADGRIEIWLNIPKVVDLFVTKTGYDPRTVRATAHQLTASTLSVLDSGGALEQRSGIDFIASFALTDDAGNDNTEVRLAFAETADISDEEFSDTGAAGSDDNPARGDHRHAMPADPVVSHESTYTHGDIATTETAIADHLADATDAHDATAISYAGGTGIAAVNVETALDELATEKSNTTHAHEASMPAGALTPYGGTAAPTGWLLANGAAVSRSTYAALFSAIGDAYGVGNGSTTFNVPDLRQRFPMGKAATGTGATLGGTGGEIDHNHTTPAGTSGAEAAHTHSFADTSGAPSDSNTFGSGASGAGDAFHTHDVSGTTGAGSSHTHSIPGANTGTENAPFQTFNYIIKT